MLEHQLRYTGQPLDPDRIYTLLAEQSQRNLEPIRPVGCLFSWRPKRPTN